MPLYVWIALSSAVYLLVAFGALYAMALMEHSGPGHLSRFDDPPAWALALFWPVTLSALTAWLVLIAPLAGAADLYPRLRARAWRRRQERKLPGARVVR